MRKVVIGLGFGDEGKGHVVDWLASQDPNQSVIRYCGGHQVGHGVQDEHTHHIFSNFGSGTMKGIPTFWNAKTCDPVGFVREYEDLKDYIPKIWISPNCPVTTPLDKEMNKKMEERHGHGTIGVGFGTTIQREEDHYHLYFQDLFHQELLEAKYAQIIEYYSRHRSLTLSDHVIHQEFFDACRKMVKLVDQDLIPTEHEIYESSQGLMLDQDYGIFPNVTRSKLGTQEIIMSPQDELYLVTRAYQTRHGNGWCSSHEFKPDAPNETNKYGTYQGEFRTRVLDLDLLKYALTIDRGICNCHWSKRNLVITCLDHLNKETGYSLTCDGHTMEFEYEWQFTDFIVKNLPDFCMVYTSHGPTHNDIKRGY